MTPFSNETSEPGRKLILSSEYLSKACPLGSKT